MNDHAPIIFGDKKSHVFQPPNIVYSTKKTFDGRFITKESLVEVRNQESRYTIKLELKNELTREMQDFLPMLNQINKCVITEDLRMPADTSFSRNIDVASAKIIAHNNQSIQVIPAFHAPIHEQDCGFIMTLKGD